MRCPSSVVRPSVVVNFSHFWLLLWNHWTEFDETLQEGRSQRPLLSLCFSGRSAEQDGRPGLWLAETFSTSPLNTLNGIQRNIIRKQDLNVLYQVCVFRADRKNKMAALASDWLRHFRLLLWNNWTEFDETLQEGRSQHPLPSLCFSGRSEKQDGRPGLWLAETFTTSPLKPLNGIQRNLIGSMISTSSTKFVFFRADRKNKMAALASDWLRHFSTSPLKPLNRIWRNLTGSKISTSSTKFVFFGPIGKTRWPPWPSDWLRHFRFLLWNHWTEFDETWQEARSQLLYQVCVFQADRKNKMAVLASDWLRHFGLLLWNRRTEFNKTWQEARSQCPLPSLCFSGRSKKQDGRPGLWLAETFSTSPLKPLNGIQRNLTGSKISTSSTKFVFFGPIGKTQWPPWPIRQKGGTLYSGARYVALWASCWFQGFEV